MEMEAVYIVLLVYTPSHLELTKKSLGNNNEQQRVSTDIVWIQRHITKTNTYYFYLNAPICSMFNILVSLAN